MRTWKWIRAAALVVAVVPLSGCLGSGSEPSADHLVRITGQIGSVHPGQAKPEVDRLLGPSRGESTRTQTTFDGQTLTLTRVRYPRAHLEAAYLSSDQAPGQAPSLFELRTDDPSYQTNDHLGVGSTYKELTAAGVSCGNITHPDAEGISADCQIGLGHGHPIVVFRVQDAHVVELLMAASGD